MSRILVADDSVSLRMLVRRVLTMHGHDVVEAPDGLCAREMLTDERPELAILDIVMPGLSGLDLCRIVRADPTLRATGLIVISANLSEDDAIAAGADAFLGKPFRPPELLSALARVAAARGVTASHAEQDRPRIERRPAELRGHPSGWRCQRSGRVRMEYPGRASAYASGRWPPVRPRSRSRIGSGDVGGRRSAGTVPPLVIRRRPLTTSSGAGRDPVPGWLFHADRDAAAELPGALADRRDVRSGLRAGVLVAALPEPVTVT